MIETVVESPPAVKQPRFCLRSLGPSATTMLANVGTPIWHNTVSAAAFGSQEINRKTYLHAIPKSRVVQ